MSVVGVTTVRNEIDIVRASLIHMSGQVDALVVIDHGSTDGTSDVIYELSDAFPMVIIRNDDPMHCQAERLTYAIEIARMHYGATWIVPFDADELWQPLNGQPLSRVLHVDAHYDVHTAKIFNHYATGLDRLRDDQHGPFDTMTWRSPEPLGLRKVAFAYRPGFILGEGNHVVSWPDFTPRVSDDLELRHFPYRSPEQFTRKAVDGAAALAGMPEDVGVHWRFYAEVERQRPGALADHWREHFFVADPVEVGWVNDPARRY